ncbi:MAG: TetR/AcrR family transcriptional regulator [Alphaproteobacteria bacterium]|nr:TetR/AcrR family transcriptional regulator [Alphaproteobacteria bacterium]
MPPPTPRPRKQARAVRTRQKLMDALDRLLREREFENISVSDIAEEAGVAVGSLYSHFRDKTAFLEALLDDWRAEVEAALAISETDANERAFRDIGNLYDALLATTRAVHEQVVQNGHILRAVHTYTRLHPEIGGEDWQALTMRSFTTIRTLFRVFAADITLADTEAAIGYLGFVFNSIFIRRALMPQDTLLDAVKLDSEALISHTADMLFAYLTRPQ